MSTTDRAHPSRGANPAAPWRPIQERFELSERELEVLRLLLNGLPNKSIARELGCSRSTVNTHVRNIFRKMKVHSRLEVASQAVRCMGMSPPPLTERLRIMQMNDCNRHFVD